MLLTVGYLLLVLVAMIIYIPLKNPILDFTTRILKAAQTSSGGE